MVRIELTELFNPGKIGSIQIKNRIMRSATFEGMASREGAVTDQLIDFYTILARGGTGLIITGASAVDSRFTVGSRCACLNDDSFIAGQKKLVKAVHEYSDVKIGSQLAHNGRLGSHPKYKPVAPSPVIFKMTNQMPKELSVDEIEALIKKFVEGGRRAFESEYDMVQLHACHGYLLSSFLSPYTNKRTDEYGGSVENRAKILIEIYQRLHEEVGKNFPILVKLQVVDGIEGGLKLTEATKIAQILVDTGFDAIEPSGGSAELQMIKKTDYTLPSLKVNGPEDENYLNSYIQDLQFVMRKSVLMQVGGIRNPKSAESLLKKGQCDFISLSRPLIYEPDIPNRWRSGDLSPVKCISCNSCVMAIFTGQPVHCVVRKKLERKQKREQRLK